MGFIGGMARLQFITVQRIELSTQANILRNNARMVQQQMADKDTSTLAQPTEGQFKYQWQDTNGNIYDPSTSNYQSWTKGNYQLSLQNNQPVQKNDNQWQSEYANAIKQYETENQKRELETERLKNYDESLQVQLTNIDTQIKALDAEEEVVKKSVDSSIKRTFGAMG